MSHNDTIDDVEFIGTGLGTVAELVSTIHSSLDTKLNNVMEQLSGIANHMTSLETRQQTLEQEVRHSTTLLSVQVDQTLVAVLKRK